MLHKGSCHCGKVTFEVETDLEQVMECNCSHCSRKGYLLNFVPREALKVTQGGDELSTYTFNKHAIQHRFCPTCGCAPFADGQKPSSGEKMAAINVRCLEGIELSTLTTIPVDGRSF
ncbi:GFA family protein [Microvirga sp. 17 mud 1-3]|uniref:GFA family protein n=1 Tax=Microvirga sp. 17 mud 1-3 TaxID=2082949 RepID=UPI000D6D6C81|nr:GFA family protein [Microvirga sp. 17 mud 1-3]AWM87825.1 aldehyde-activating protein [Microvirga sp. 17 mud 1-3]